MLAAVSVATMYLRPNPLLNNVQSSADLTHKPSPLSFFVQCFSLCLFNTGDVVQTEPKGWSEAMGLGEHELEGWEGPTEPEVARDVAVEVREHLYDESKLESRRRSGI